MRMQFNPGFFTPVQVPPAPPQASASSSAPASPLLYSPARYQSLNAFLQHEDYARLEHEYREIIDRIPDFAAANADKVAPPLSRASLNRIRADCEAFKHQLFHQQGALYDAHREIMYGIAKETLTAFTELLADQSLALHKRLDAVVNLTPQLRVCSGGTMTELTNELQKLRAARSGIKGAAMQLKKRMAQAAIAEHIRARHPDFNPGNEVHLVNFYLDQVAGELGLSLEQDSFLQSVAADVTPGLIAECKKRVFAVLKPGRLIASMADDYFGRVRAAAGAPVSVDAPLGNAELQKISDVKQQELDPEYGEVSMHSFIRLGEDDSVSHLAGTPGGIAEEMARSMHGQGLINVDNAIALSEASDAGGAIMLLGHLFWTRDKEGRCDPLPARRWFELSPLALRNHPDIDGDDLAVVLTNMAQHILDQTDAENLQPGDMPAGWLDDFLKVVMAVPSLVTACAGHLLFLGASFGETQVVKRIQGFVHDRPRYRGIDSPDAQRRTPLMLAAMRGHAETVDLLLQKGANLKAVTRGRDTALHLAASHGHVEVIGRLIAAGAEIDASNGSRRTPAMLAAEGGHAAVLDVLLEQGANLKAVTRGGNTALHLAARHGHVGVIRRLIAAGAGLDALNHSNQTAAILAAGGGHTEALRLLIDGGANLGDTPLPAARSGRLETLELLLDLGFDKHKNMLLPQQSGRQRTVLMEAARLGHLEMLGMLLERGADPNVTTPRHESTTALHLAADAGQTKVVECLLDHGASLNLGDGWKYTPVMLATKGGHLETLKSLIDRGADLNVSADRGTTALMVAADWGRIEALQLIIDKGGNIDDTNDDNRTALLQAAARGRTEVVRVLAEKGANVNAADNNGETPLLLAIQRRDTAAVEVLLEKGADVNARNRAGSTPLLLAVNQGTGDMVRLLAEKGANVNAADHEGEPLLLLAIRKGDPAIVEALIDKGADVNVRNADGSTPILMAVDQGMADVVRALARRGADLDATDSEGVAPLLLAMQKEDRSLAEALIDNYADVNVRNNAGATPLMLAAEANDVELVEQLVARGADVKLEAPGGRTPAVIAAEADKPGILAVLFGAGALDDAWLALSRPAMFTGIRSLLANLDPDMRLPILLALCKGLRAAIADKRVEGLNGFVQTVNAAVSPPDEAVAPLDRRQCNRLLSAIRGAQKYPHGLCNTKEYTQLKQSNPDLYQNFKALKQLLKSQ
ncbi:ankyrin repeat domain-containing protein [Noviherbaspirillum aridicola]|uniref:Ankyrin repeat protein n=1 Tax=Noviherbaspirillum aridicola TaxID=2849687 RepID=A0ABQ4Q9L2_9BURK|nr:ankyrin repeat domain-containing protein [Noviherbaspirillum aridicola]GIZ53848.1 hypothetical protein NCCP691_38620 [Noviherbaspirillum aridicola]